VKSVLIECKLEPELELLEMFQGLVGYE